MRTPAKQISLTNGLTATVDVSDFSFLSNWNWGCNNKGYVCRTENELSAAGIVRRVGVFMHRAIVLPPAGYEVDHIDGDKLNNQRSNLRVCTRVENCRNQKKSSGTSSQYKGVTWHKRDRRWQASIKINYRYIHLGLYRTEIEAAEAYDRAAIRWFGEFARLNLAEHQADAV